MTSQKKKKRNGNSKSWSGRSMVKATAGVAPNLMADEELVAVLAAAIAAFGGNSVIVKHIKRIDTSPNWVHAGKRANVAMRQI